MPESNAAPRTERPRVAVLLNANAKAVDEKLRREIARFVPSEDVYYSRSLTDARAIAATVVARGYDTVLTGGGDGTFVGYVNSIASAAAETARGPRGVVTRGGAVLQLAPAPVPVPRFGVLHLGTGNALARLMGASPSRTGVVEDILRTRTGDLRTRRLHLLTVNGKRAPFAGLGIDGKVLNDYASLRDSLGKTPFKPLFTGGPGYFFAVAGRSVPYYLFKRQVPNVVIYNDGAPARLVAPDGRPVGRPFAKGEILYQGPCRLAAAGTIPYYGYGLTIFPHALKAPGRMQLRVTALGAVEALKVLRQVWKGRTPPGLLDFHVDRVRLEFDCKMPLQVGGDGEGYHDTVEMSVDPRPLDVLDFRAPRA